MAPWVRKIKNAQILLDSFIPMGMLVGCIIGLIFGMFFPDYSLLAVSLGAGIGYLFGFLLMNFIARQKTIIHNPKRRDYKISEDKKSPQSINFKGSLFSFTYIRTAVPLTATINIPSRTTS